MKLHNILVLGLIVVMMMVGVASAVGQFSISFDDGFKNVSTLYYPIMQARGIPGTIYEEIIQYEGGGPSRMNISDVLILQNNGWEISSHTYNHALLNNTSLNYTLELLDSRTYLENNGLYPSGIAYPGGYYNSNIIKEVSEYYQYARAVIGMYGGMPYTVNVPYPSFGYDTTYLNEKYQVNSYLLGTTPAATTQTVLDLINTSISDGTWISLYCHNTECNNSVNLTAIMDYVKQERDNENLTVVTIRDGFENYRTISTNVTTINHSINYKLLGAQIDGTTIDKPIYNNVYNFKQDIFNYNIDIIGRNVTNLVSNPSFESGLTGWTSTIQSAKNTTITADTGNTSAVDGSYVLRINQSSNGSSYYAYATSGFIAVEPNQTYEISGYINTSNAVCNNVQKAYISAVEYNISQTAIPGTTRYSSEVYSTTNPSTTNFTNYLVFQNITNANRSYKFTTSANTNYVKINLRFDYCTGIAFFDAIQMTKGLRMPPFINSSNNTAVSPIVNINNITYNLPDLDDNETYTITNFTNPLITNISGSASGSGDFDYRIYGKRYFNAVHSWINRSSNGSYYVEKVFFPPNASVEFWDNVSIERYNNLDFKIRPNIQASIGNFIIIPEDNLTVNITIWNSTNAVFNESSSNATNQVEYRIGDRTANQKYSIKTFWDNGTLLKDFSAESNSTGYLNYNSTVFGSPRYTEIIIDNKLNPFVPVGIAGGSAILIMLYTWYRRLRGKGVLIIVNLWRY